MEDRATARMVLRGDLFMYIVEPGIGIRHRQIACEMCDTGGNEFPGPFVERLGRWARSGVRDKASNALRQIISIGLDWFWRPVDGDNRKIVREQLVLGQIVDR